MNTHFDLNNVSGSIQEYIGTGQNAKDALVYLFIKWILWVGIILTAFSCIYFIVAEFLLPENQINLLVDTFKGIWGIVTPLITLALGYHFGRKK